MATQLTLSTDEELAHRLRHRDTEALGEVHAAHQTALFSTARAILRDHDAAFDVTQDVLTHLWEHPGKFDPQRGSLRSYLITRTRSRALDVLRSETSRRRRESRRLGDHRTERAVDEVVTDRNSAQILRERLTSLEAKERDAISLAFFGDLSYREVAERLSIPEGTAKSRIRTGLARLRQELGGAAA